MSQKNQASELHNDKMEEREKEDQVGRGVGDRRGRGDRWKKIGEKKVEQEKLRKGPRKGSGKESGETSGKDSDRSKGSVVEKDKGMKEGGTLNVKTGVIEQKKGVQDEVMAKKEKSERKIKEEGRRALKEAEDKKKIE
ncbi:hypothetical protein TSAR_002826 [Trichomalopsis sarcophagae]|uniref:Uncharacterized protein n=1 Tax=Trichomalopsis sarcophagae TaxID=543379 RepID=A0A232FHD9_9HYME|nr:hypothetical protein TSAR_002826 [Trichomalopsis sarcophagae]